MKTRLRFLLRERDVRGNVGEDVLSVYRDHGVVPKADRDDNFNKTPQDVSLYKLVLPGDVVINKMKAWQGSVAVSRHRGIVSGDYLVCEVTGNVHRPFLHHLLRSRPLIAQYAMRSSGIRPSQWRLYWDDLADIEIELPDDATQTRVADFLDAETERLDALLEARRRMVASLHERRAAVTHASFSGCLASDSMERTELPWLDAMPRHWRTAKLNLVARLGSGHTPSRDHPEWWVPVECVVPWITTGEVAQMRSDRIEYVTETRECVSEIGIANSAAEIHPAGTVVLCRTASAGYSAIMGNDMATSQDFATWTCGPLLRPRFLLICLRAMRQDLLGRLAMGSTHKTIYMPDIESIRIPLPPVEEQDQIVGDVWRRLRAIDRAIDAIDVQNDLVQERRHALIAAAVTGERDVSKAA